jgi:adenylate cyclase
MFVDLRKRDNLLRFLPEPVARRLLEHGESALQPVQREVTVLFVDIRDFTTLSESLAPRDVLQFLDEFFGHLSQIVKGHDGIVNKFLGDGMLAFWGVPETDAAHATNALKAVLDIRREVSDLNAQRIQHGLAPIRVGMGVHSGTVAAGMLGGADQHEYTIIGDAVNVASRVEGLTKLHGLDALASESTWRLCNGRFRGARVAEEKVKGRQETVVVYSVLESLPRSESVAA